MLDSKKYDFLIVGAGIMGLAIAKVLTEQFPTASIAMIEKESRLGLHASGRNSGVLHSGIYYPEESLKAKVCAEGARRMHLFAFKHKIACQTVGKVIIPTRADDLPTVDYLLKNAEKNAIRAYKVTAKEIHDVEPYANPYECGIYLPDVACIDSVAVLKTLREILMANNVDMYFDCALISVEPDKHCVTTTKGLLQFGFLFNCAGFNTDIIAKQFGCAKDYALLPFKGIYYKLKKEKNYLVNGNIYPVPDLKLPFLGVHFTKTIAGDVYVGPTAIPALGRENYGLFDGMSVEAFRILKDLTALYVANHQHFRSLIHAEMKKYLKPYFVQSSRKLMSSFNSNDLLPSNKVGIRPQLINIKTKKIEMDYIIEKTPNSLHVLNAISPAFTGAFAFADWIVANKM